MKNLGYFLALGWLAFGGTMHFVIDVLKQHFIHHREFNEVTRLFYGMHSAYAASQVLFAAVGLVLLLQAPDVARGTAYAIVAFAAAAAWLAIGFAFIDYWEPKLIAAIFLALFTAATIHARL